MWSLLWPYHLYSVLGFGIADRIFLFGIGITELRRLRIAISYASVSRHNTAASVRGMPRSFRDEMVALARDLEWDGTVTE